MRLLVWSLSAVVAVCGIAASAPKPPDAVIIFTGDIRGYLSPCGCSAPMVGGIERMAGIVRQLKLQPQSIYVDVGNWLEGYDRQEQLKAETLAETWKTLKPTYINVSARDRLLGDGYLESLRGVVGGAIDSANELSAALPGHSYITAGKVSVTGVTSPEADALAETVPGEKVVLISGSLGAARRAARVGGPGLYIYSLQGDPPQNPIAEDGATFVTVGDHCRFVGRIELRDGKWTGFKLFELGPEHESDPNAVDAYRGYLRRVTAENLLAQVPKAKGGPSFVGSEACRSCHVDEFEAWEKSLHGEAYRTLQKTGNDRDPECVGCHVVGLNHESGFTSVQDKPALASVGCESCHGAGSDHVQSPYAAYGKAGEASCMKCHATANSPGFSFAEYWKRIAH